MARTIPCIHDDRLTYHDNRTTYTLCVGSEAWWAWLDTAPTNSFRFVSPHGRFTARRERTRSGVYWYAYRRQRGQLHKVYIGKSVDLTLARLQNVAATLSRRYAAAPPPAAPVEDIPPRGLAAPRDTLLLATKWHTPAPPISLVPRPRLLERLNLALTVKLTLISAPAGYGKTTLLAAWVAEQPQPVVWLSLDAGDNDPVRLLTYLITAVQQFHPAVGAGALQLFRSPQFPPLSTAMTLLINDLNTLPAPLVLVLDDYHVITAEPVHQALNLLLDHAPKTLHLVVASRTDPPLPLPRLRAGGGLVEVRAADLSFTHAETTQFLTQRMGLSLLPDQVTALVARTEGWVAGLQLIALSLQGRADWAQRLATVQGRQHTVLDYLVAEVLQHQPANVRSFLLQTAILGRFCAALCATVTGQADCAAILEQLGRDNLFLIPLDAEQHWYRYHHLFADVLRAQLERTQPESIAGLHRRAAGWHAGHGFILEAIEHAFAAEDAMLAAGLVEQVGQRMLMRGEITTLWRWLQALPDEVVRRWPRLYLAYAWRSIIVRDLPAVAGAIQSAEQALADAAPVETPGQSDRASLRAEIAVTHAYLARYQGDLAQAMAYSQQALATLPLDNRYLRGMLLYNLGATYDLLDAVTDAGRAFTEAVSVSQAADNSFTSILAANYLAIVHVLQGQLRQAGAIYRRALQVAVERGWRSLPMVGYLLVGLGELCYERNELEAAQGHIEEGIALARLGGIADVEQAGQVALAFVKQAQGQPQAARALLRGVAQDVPFESWVASAQARLAWLQGNVVDAASWARACAARAHDDPCLLRPWEFGYLTLAHVRIAQGQAESVAPLLNRLCEAAVTARRTGSLIQILSVEALTNQAQGRTAEALERLTQALELAEPEGYVHTFIDLGAPLVTLLRQLRRTHARPAGVGGLTTAYLDKLLAAVGTPPEEGRTPDMPAPLATLFSPREQEVLRLLIAGRANQEIADALVIATSTAKRHLQNIYRKLGVRSRAAAIARVRDDKFE